jgi:hypothetical protein
MGKVLVDLRADAKGAIVTASLRVAASDIALIAAYDEAAERYFEWRSQHGGRR